MHSGSESSCNAVGSHLEAGQFAAVIHTHWLDLWRFAVQVSVVQSFHLTLLISKPSCHFLSGYGSGQVLALRVAKETDNRTISMCK